MRTLHSASRFASLRQPTEQFTQPDTWEVVDHMVRQLENCRGSSEQIDLALHTIRASIRADVVCWYSGLTQEIRLTNAEPHVTPAWCRDCTREPVGTGLESGSQLLWPASGVWREAVTGTPRSVALVRVSKSRQIWFLAVSFDPLRVFQAADLKLMGVVQRLLLGQLRQTRAQEKLRDTVLGLVHSLVVSLQAKNPYTSGHSERVARIAARLGQEMGLAPAMVGDLYLAGLLHDIGKIGVRDDVLLKAGPLTDSERVNIEQHPAIGDAILARTSMLARLRPGVRHHHERYDGQGYPDRLAGDRIPLLARILAVADSCDAMMAARPYRAAMPPERVDAIMKEGAGTYWDPRIIAHFMTCHEELYGICQKGIGDSMVQAVDEILRSAEDA